MVMPKPIKCPQCQQSVECLSLYGSEADTLFCYCNEVIWFTNGALSRARQSTDTASHETTDSSSCLFNLYV